nr:probable polyketide synthase 16 [Misgurnus anguillicaudatus]
MMDDDTDIAVVGIGCNFPGGEGLENFWQVLLHGKNCAVQIPNERFDLSQWYDSDDSKAGKTYTAKAALIDGLNEFDHKFFGITDAESTNMDPQHKLLLQCTYRALEDAGIPMEKASGTRTGVFLGLMNRDFELGSVKINPKLINHSSATGSSMCIAANRISYSFNFTGPSLSIDCACSSSLVALHFACQAIRQGDCEMAVCGGVTCILEPTVFVALSKAKMISSDGTSKPFSSKADGYGRGEGCGVVLLKPLKKALQDHGHIWGIISKTAVNQDGHTVSPITKPSMVQQEELLRKIYSAYTDLSSVQYIEAHGTGTPVGDPIEAGSISKVVAKARPRESGPLLIGSVKSNIGHTESAAGVAGLIKILLMMKHETFVPSVFYSEENSSIDTKSLNLRIPTTTEKWVSSHNAVRTAGVNNFGFGGTNAHAIIQQYVQPKKTRAQIDKSHQFLVLSAASEKSMKNVIEDTAKQISAGTISDLQVLLYTSACRRSHLKHKYRKVFQTSSLTDLKGTLTAALQKKLEPSKTDSKLVFVFCGNGVTYHGMCRHLLKKESLFKEVIMKIDTLMQSYTSLNLMEKLNSESNDFSDPKVIQPLLFAVQVAIASLLKHWGVSPDVVLGHSIGEVAAAHCSGLLSLEDAVKVIHYRSSLQSTVTGGKMLVVSNMAVSEILKVIPSYSGRVCLAAYNSPQSCTLSGDADDIDRLHQNLSNSARGKDLFLHILDVPAAYHSHKMDPIVSRVKENIGLLQGHGLVAELFSTVTGESLRSSDFTTGEYWARNIREPVAFEQAVRSAVKNKRNIIFVEIGPRRSLQRYITETLGNDINVLPSVQPEKDHETVLATVSKLFEHGVKVDWEMFYKGFETEPIPYPRYQFDNVKKDVFSSDFQLVGSTSNHPVIRQHSADSSLFSCDLSSDSVAFLQDHKHNGVAILPGAFYAELGLASFMVFAKPKVPLSSLQLSITFQNPFVFTQNAPEMKVQMDQSYNLAENTCNFKIQSTSAIYASGTVEVKPNRVPEEQFISLDTVFKRCTMMMSSEQIYKNLSHVGFDYSSVFRNKTDVYCGEEFKECLSVLKIPMELLPQLHDYYIHPVVLDHVMQLIPTTMIHDLSSRPQFPAKIGSLTVYEPLQEKMFVYLKAVHMEEDGFEICGCLTNKQGKVLVELRHVWIRMLGSHYRVVEEYFYHNSFTIISEEATLNTSIKALVFTDEVGFFKGLQQYLHPASKYISTSQNKTLLECGLEPVLSKLNISSIKKNFQDILFIWGNADLSSFKSEIILDSMAACCEIFRRIIAYLKAVKFPGAIRVITNRSSESLVDHISPGFVLLGMTRACAAELPELSFQLIDMDSASSKDIRTLVQVLSSYPCTKYPELVVQDGKILKPEITHTPLPKTEIPKQSIHMWNDETCFLQTSDPYDMTNISATQVDNSIEPISGKHIEVHLSKICVHSSDYFPVSTSDFTYGHTMYWDRHTTQHHKLLALDFSGIVTAVGKDVRKLKVGDEIVCCYPAAARSKVVLPAAVCYKAKKLSFLKDTPCVSFIVLAWEILHEVLPKAKQKKLGIFSTVPDSSLIKVLTATAHRSGWNVKVSTEANQIAFDFNEVDGTILIPPYNKEVIETVNNVTVIKDVVLVYDNQSNLPVDPKTFRGSNEVHIHYLFMSQIMQQQYLQIQMPQIYHWLKSMHLDRKSLALDMTTFQRVKSHDIDIFSVKESESYFTHQILPIITLNDAKNQLSDIPVLPKQNLFQKGSVYIVTGGLTGLGFETVKFIAQKGGGNIVIFSRSNPNPQIQQEIQNISNNYGSVIKCLQCDVSISEQVQQAIVQIEKRFPSSPIKGVFHSAVVLHDGLIESLDKSLYEKVMRPKVNGVINLHNATKHCNLDYFVCYSSISAFIGNASQTNYAAANTFLDSFCQYRRNIGLQGQSINWGGLNLGLLLNKDQFRRFLEAKGIMLMEVPEIIESLEQCLTINKPQQVVCKFNFKNNWNNVLSQNKSLSARLSRLIEEEVRKARMTLSRPERTIISPREYMMSMISETTGIETDELNDDVHLVDVGIDSMLAMTLQNHLFVDKAINVPLVTLLDPNSTLSTLIKILEGNDVEGHQGKEETTYL